MFFQRDPSVMRLAVLCLGATIVLTACSTITIGEDEVFYPKPSVTPATFDLEGVTLEDRFLDVSDSVTVNTWHLSQEAPRATVLFFGGNGFYLVQSRAYIRSLTRPRVNVLLWDYRGYGRSEGDPGVEALRDDALAVYDHLVEERGVNRQHLILWGHSLGSFLATHVAAERPVGGVVLENPATDAEDWVQHLIPWYVRLFLGVEVDPVLQKENNVRRVSALTVPLLVVAGTEDNVTDPEMARTLYEAAGSEHKRLVEVEGGGHNGLHEAENVRAAYEDLVQRVGEGDSSSEGKTGRANGKEDAF